jgi:uncharacterized protein YlaI
MSNYFCPCCGHRKLEPKPDRVYLCRDCYHRFQIFEDSPVEWYVGIEVYLPLAQRDQVEEPYGSQTHQTQGDKGVSL